MIPSRVRSGLRHLAERSLQFAPARQRHGRTLILAYHNVLPGVTQPMGDASLHLALDRFVAQLEMIASHADVVSLDEACLAPPATQPRVVITFDDAYQGAIEHGVAACVAAGLPCTVFVSPGLLGRIPAWDIKAATNAWSDDARHTYLWSEQGIGGHAAPADVMHQGAGLDRLVIADVDAIRQVCASPLVRVGNHTMHHANLGAVPTATAVEEVTGARAWVAHTFGGAAVNWLAYPYGLAPDNADALMQQCGVSGAVLVTGGWTTAPSDRTARVPRWNVPAGISDDGFRLRLRGWFA